MKMKQRGLCLILCIALVLPLLPATVFAAGATTYKVWVGGVQVTSDNMNDVLGDGKVSYDPAKSILTLNNANIAAVKRSSTVTQNAAIYTEVNLIIRLAEGSVNTVTADLPASGYQYGIYTGGLRRSLSVQGQGVLNVTAADTTSASYAIYSMIGFEVSYGAVVNAVSGTAADSCALKVYDGDIIVSADSVLNAKAGHGSAGSQSYGIKANTNAVWVQSGKLTAQGDTLAVEAASIQLSANEGLTTRIVAGSDYAGTQTADYDLTSNKYILAGAFQPVTEYNVWVGSTQVTGANKDDVLGDGKISFEIVDGTPTLTVLEGAKISGAYKYSMIYAENTDLVINAPKGLTTECAEKYGVYIKGEGNLTIKGDVNITLSGYCDRAIYTENGSITINGDVKVHSGSSAIRSGDCAVYAAKNVSVAGSADVDGFSYGLYSNYGSITVNGDVKAQTEWQGLHTNNYGNIRVDGDVNITVSTNWMAIYANHGSVSIGGNATVRYIGTVASTWEALGIGNNCTITGDVDIEGFKEGVHAQNEITIGGSAIIKATEYGLYTREGNITMVSGTWDITSTNDKAISAGKNIVLPDAHTITTPEGGTAKYGTVYESDGKTAAKHVVIATPTEYDVWVNEERFTSEKLTIQCGKGTATYDPETKTVILNGAQITYSKYPENGAIYSYHAITILVATDSSIDTHDRGIYVNSGDLTLNLEGNLTISSETYGIYVNKGGLALNLKGNLTVFGHYAGIAVYGDSAEISGTGDVTVTSDGDGIYVSGVSGSDLTISCGNVSVSSSYKGIFAGNNIGIFNAGDITVKAGSEGICTYNGDVTISGSGDITVDSKSFPFYAKTDITISNNGKVNVTTADTSHDGITVYYGDVVISGNGDVTITAGEGIYTEKGNIVISGDHKVVVNAENYGIYSHDGNVTVSGTGEVTVTAGELGIFAYRGSLEINGGVVNVTSNTREAVYADGGITIADTHRITTPAGGVKGEKTIYESDGKTAAKHAVIEAAVCAHTNTEVRNAVPAGCKAEGYTGDTYCKDCGEKLASGTVIGKTAHYYVSGASHAPTCTEDGYVDMTCVYCGDTYQAENGNKAFGHVFGEWRTIKEPTVTAPGQEEHTCAVCGAKETREIPVLTAVLWGDVNDDGEITTKDMAQLRKYLANMDFNTGVSSVTVGKGADVNGDGTITSKDMALLRKYFANFDFDTGKSTVALGPTV